MKNIAFINSMDSWGGGEKWHFETAIYFMEAGNKVHFFLSKNSELHKRLGSYPDIKLHFINVTGRSFLNPVKVLKLKALFIKEQIEVVLINLSHDLKLAGLTGTKAGIHRIIYTRGVAYPIKNSALNRYVFSHWLTDILASSKATAAAILQKNPTLFPKEKIKVIYNPLDVKEFTTRPHKPIYSRRKNEIIIGSLGRLEKEKNHVFLIYLSEYLSKNQIEHTILIGGAGSLEAELKEEINKKGLSAQFVFTGFLENVKDLLMCCDIFILPSLLEGFGFVIAEASLCEKPVIAFNTSSIPELVKDESSGFIVAVNDVKQCAEKVILLKNDPERVHSMGKNGFEYVRDKFNKEKIMKELEVFVN